MFLGFKLNIHDPGLEETEDNCVNNLTKIIVLIINNLVLIK